MSETSPTLRITRAVEELLLFHMAAKMNEASTKSAPRPQASSASQPRAALVCAGGRNDRHGFAPAELLGSGVAAAEWGLAFRDRLGPRSKPP